MKDGTDIDPREERLPAWVRDKLKVLRMRVAEAREAADATLGSGERSAVWLQLPSGDFEYAPSQWRRARFMAGPGEHDWIEVHVAPGRRGVEIRAHDELMVLPQGGNTVAVLPARSFLSDPPTYLRPFLRATKAEGLDAERGTGAEAVIGRSTP